MRPHLPLSLLSALLVSLASPAWADYTLTENGSTTIKYENDKYVLTLPDGTTSDLDMGDTSMIFVTDITDAGTYENGYERTLTLESGTYTGLRLWNVGGGTGATTMAGTNSFVLNIGAGVNLALPNGAGSNFMNWGNQTREVHADITLNVEEGVTINAFTLIGDGNGQDVYKTFGNYQATINGGTWSGTTADGVSWCFGLGQESFYHTGNVDYTINGGTFASFVTAGVVRGMGQSSTINGDVKLTITGGTFNGHVALLGKAGVTLAEGGSATMNVSGGVFNGNVFGDGGTMSVTGGEFQGIVAGGSWANTNTRSLNSTSLTLDLGEASTAATILGGSWVETGASSINITGSSNLTIKSGTYTGLIWGGSRINGTATATISGNIGATHVVVEGGIFNGATISGGTYIERNNSSGALTIGETHVDIIGGTFTDAFIYGGGKKVNASTLTTTLSKVSITGNNATFSGTMISGGGQGDTVSSAILTLSGVNKTDALAGATIENFDAIAADSDTDAVIVNATVLDGRETFTKSGDGKVTLAAAAGFNNALAVTGGELRFGLADGVSFGSAISLSAGARLTSAGNMTLAPTGGITIDLTGMNSTGSAVIESGGTLAFSADGTLNLYISGVDDTMENDYKLITAADFGDLTASNFSYTPTGLSEEFTYTLDLAGDTLYLRVASLADSLTWNGGASGTWVATGGETIWKTTGGSDVAYDVAMSATFEDLSGVAQSDVTLDGDVSSPRITVNNKDTAYLFTGDGALVDGSEATALVKRGEGVLSIENTGANTFSGGTTLVDGVINLNAAQGLGTGAVTLNGGELTLGETGSLIDTNKIAFNGGEFVYAEGATQDISGLIDTVNSTGAIRVDTTENNVVWNTYNQEIGNMAIEKNGAGMLTINLNIGGTFTGPITVNAGYLFYDIGATSLTRTWSGSIAVAAGATLQFRDTRAHDSTYVDTLSGSISGAGTVILGHKEGGTYPGGGRFSVSGDNSGFTGTFELVGNGTNRGCLEVGFANAAAIGGANLVLDGRGFFLANTSAAVTADIYVKATGSWINGNSNQTLTLAGALTSEEGANLGITTNNPAMTVVFTGDLSAYVGTLNVTSNATMSFGNGSAASLTESGEFIKAATLGGAGSYRVNYSGTGQDIVYAGVLADTAKLNVQGTDKLVLTGANESTAAMTIAAGSTVQLGDGTADNAAWLGTVTGAGSLIVNTTGTYAMGDRANDLTGTVTLVQGTLDLSDAAVTTNIVVESGALGNAAAYAGSATNGVHVDAAAGAGEIALGGLDAAQLGAVTLTEGAYVTGLKDGSVWTVSGADNTMTLSADNMSGAPFTGTTALVQFDGTGSVTFADDALITLDITGIVEQMKLAEGDLEILFTNGTFTQSLAEVKSHLSSNPLFAAIGFDITEINGGNLVLSGDTSLVYVASVDGTGSAAAPISGRELNFYQAVIVNEDMYVESDGSMLIRNLTAPGSEAGQTGTGNLIVTNAAGNMGSIELQNNLTADGAGVDTAFAGDIVGLDGSAANTDLVKTGANKLTLSGAVTLAGDLIAREGALQLDGKAAAAALQLDSTDAAAKAEVGVGDQLSVERLVSGANGGELNINEGAAVTLSGESADLTNVTIDGQGELNVLEGAVLTMGAGSTVNGVELNVDGAVTLSEAASASGLNGAGNMNLNAQTLNIQTQAGQDHSFSGALGAGQLTIAGSGSQTLRTSAADTDLTVNGGNLTLQGQTATDAAHLSYGNLTNNGNLTIMASENALTGINTTLSVQDATFTAGSLTSFKLNSDEDMTATFIQAAGNIVIEDGAQFHLETLTGVNVSWDPGNPMELTLMELTGTGTLQLGSNTLTVGGLFMTYYKNAELVQDGNKVMLKAEEQTDNVYADAATTTNSMAGAELIWAASRSQTVDTEMKDFLTALNDYMVSDSAAASHAMSAMAGSTVTALGMAQRDALSSRMGWLRNRVTQMGVNPALVNEDMPYFHMWMEGTGSYTSLDTSGDESGYKLSTWGATLGFDADLSDSFTVGAAFGVDYGDLTATAADSASGDLDSYYVSIFGRYQHKSWAHTLILTGGWNDASLDRTVNYGAGSYSTQGSTDGSGFGAMYEVTYDIALNEDRSSILQPLFNASFVHTCMGAYSEEGAGNMGLNVEEQTMQTGTLALGARWMGLVGSNIFGREALAEVRVNVAQDFGDSRGEAGVGLSATPGYYRTVYGAEAGKTALQLGVGMSVPVGYQGMIFLNGNADIRSGASAVSGSIGYRYDF